MSFFLSFFSIVVPFSFILNLFGLPYLSKLNIRFRFSLIESLVFCKNPDLTVSYPTYFCVALNLLIRK